MNTAWFEGSASQIVCRAAAQAGLKLLCSGPVPASPDMIVLAIKRKPVESGPLPSDGYEFVPATNKPARIVGQSQRALAYALMDLAEKKIDLQASVRHDPLLEFRSYHMWLPFALGQAYGGQGYCVWEQRTDWWWYDRQYWGSFLEELASARFNMIVFWHTHPHPALIEYGQFPEAAFFNAERQAENIQQFQWILQTAKGYGIDIVLMQYNIHVSPGFAKKHEIGAIKADAGYGGEDTQLMREYNCYCLEQLFKTYPELSGLMICGELNKDAFDFLEAAILPPLLEAESKPILHFRLWGQHFPDEVRKLADKIKGRFVMWHKISKEMISVPQADVRFSRWHERLADVPICAITGSGNASAFRHQGRIYVDPDFVAKQLVDLKKKGGSGVGLFTGMDNWFYDKDGLVGNEDSIRHWMSANWLTRQITGCLAWRVADSSEEFWVEKLRRHYCMDRQDSRDVLSAAVSSSRILPAINCVVGQYGQNIGFLGALGMFSQQTAADKAGNYRLGGPYAWPLHDWGVEQPDIMQAARSGEQTALLLDMAEKIEKKCSEDLENIPEFDKELGISDLINYIKLNGLLGSVHTNLFKGAVHAYRVAFSEDVQEAIKHLEAVVGHLDETQRYAKESAEWAHQIPIVPVNIREDLPTPLRWGEDWLPRIQKESKVYLRTLKHLRSHQELFTTAKIYWQSHCYYHDVFRWLRENGYHLTDENLQRAGEILDESIALAQRCLETAAAGSDGCRAVPKWLDFLKVEAERLNPSAMKVYRYDGGIESHTLQDVVSHWEGLISPCSFDETLLSFFEPDSVDFVLRKSHVLRQFRLAYDDEWLWLSIECPGAEIPGTVGLFICNRDTETVQHLEIGLYTGKAKSVLGCLRAPHGMAFDEPIECYTDVKHSSASQHIGSFLIKVPFEVVGGFAKAGGKWGFNLLWGKRGLLWSPVPGEFNWFDPAQAGTIYFES
ncbi:MAG: hypothetical protein ABIG61_03030 [Planctomycetota bacterium]